LPGAGIVKGAAASPLNTFTGDVAYREIQIVK